MKILMLNANRAGIGTYHRALHFGRELARRDHHVTIMTVSNTRRFRAEVRHEGERLTIVEGPNWLDEILPWHASGPLEIWLRLRELWTGAYDVVYAFEYQPNIAIPVAIARRFRSFTLISDWCDWHAGAGYHFGGYRLAHAIDRYFEERIRHRADFVTTINRTLFDRARAIGVAAWRLAIVGEGVDPSYIVPLDRQAARRELGIPDTGPIVGTIRDADRCTAILCEAVRLLPGVRLLAIGSNPAAAIEHARRAGISDRLVATGRVSDADLPKYLAAADVLALPLADNLVNRGRWPHKLGDMLAAQRPVVISHGGEFSELIEQRACGVVTDYSAAGFARAIEDVLARPEHHAAIAQRGRALIETELNWDVIGVHLADALERAVQAGARRAPDRAAAAAGAGTSAQGMPGS
jgi:glycosyltransferase involved in cell wall biosynthesis